MKIAITGGKGGTGKSTLAVYLAKKLSEYYKVVLVDVDVENPNDNTFFKYKLRLKKVVYENLPKIDYKKCKKCGICAKKCRFGAIAWIPGKYPKIFYDVCKGCMLCKFVCPYGAIKEKKEVIGFIRVGGRNPKLVEGKAKIGFEETSKVVRETINFAEKLKYDIIIIDTAAGIHCNVMEALDRSDLIIFVAEPTPFGIEDLRRILEATKEINSKKYIVINKAGIGEEDEILKIAKEYEIEILAKIPHDEKIAREYAIGKIPDLKLDLREIL